MTKFLVVRPDGTAKVESLDFDGIKNVLNGGYIELIVLTKDVQAYLDDDGKSKQLPINLLANQIVKDLQVGLWPGDYIVGPMVVFSPLDENGHHDGDEHDVPDWFAQKYSTKKKNEI